MYNYWIIIISLFISVFCNTENHDITLLINHKNEKVQATCIGGPNLNGSALFFLRPLIEEKDNALNQHSENINPDNEIETKFFNEYMAKNVTSGVGPFIMVKPVLDERWQKFQTHQLEPNGTRNISFVYDQEKRSISISIRLSKGSIVSLDLNSNKTKLPSIIKIYKTYEDKISVECPEKFNCSTIFKNTTNIMLDENIWFHFTILYDENSKSFIVYDINDNILLHFSADIDNITYLRVNQIQGFGLWKFHDYEFVRLHSSKINSRYEVINSQLQPDDDNIICVTFYALVCKNCSMDFDLNDNKTKQTIQGFRSKVLQPWQYVKLEIKFNSSNENYKLMVTTSKNENSGFWAIDNLRRCHRNEKRIIKKTFNDDKHFRISCISLLHSNSPVEDFQLSVDKNCQVDCKFIAGKSVCNNYLCEFTSEDSFIWTSLVILFFGIIITLLIVYFIFRNCNICKSRNINSTIRSQSFPLLSNYEENRKSSIKYLYLQHLKKSIEKSLEIQDIHRQYETIKKNSNFSMYYGTKPENNFKNRYDNFAAYDHSRVKLKKVDNDDFSDYINANYIDGYDKEKAYIATQKPKLNTMNDFWRMIWQEQVEYIIALVAVSQNNKERYEEYWPDGTKIFIDIEVQHIEENVYSNYLIRTLKLRKDYESRYVQQLQLSSWPANEESTHWQSLVLFLERIISINNRNNPIVIQSTSGFSRCGIIILTDICIRMILKEKNFDALKYLNIINKQRRSLISCVEHYVQVHKLILNLISIPIGRVLCDNTTASRIKNIIASDEIDAQMEILQQVPKHTKKFTNIEQNFAKNRLISLVPENERILITRYPAHDIHSDYINAVPVTGFKCNNKFIVTQSPLPNTTNDFWRMVIDQNTKLIIVLNEIDPDDKQCPLFWPENNQKYVMANLSLQTKSVEINKIVDKYNILLTNRKKMNETSDIQIFQFKNWRKHNNIPNNLMDFVKFIDDVISVPNNQKPIIVTCYDGLTASGLFVSLSYLIQNIKFYKSFDVCKTIKVIRINRPEFIINKAQFTCLYETVLMYIKKNNVK